MSGRQLSAGAALGLAVVLAACGSPPGSTTGPPATMPRAAEPATSPPPAVAPTGTVVAAGTAAEGVAVDPSTGIIAAGELHGASLFDEAGTHLATVRLPSAPRHIALEAPGGPFLIPAEASAEVGFVNEPSGEVATTAPTGRMPHDVTSLNGVVFVGNEHDSTLTVIRPGRPIATIQVAHQPGGLAAIGSDIAVVSVRARRLQLFDATSLRLVGSVHLAGGPSHVAAYGSELFVVDTGGTSVSAFATVPRLHRLWSEIVPRSPLGMAVDPTRGHLWITSTASNRLVELSIAKKRPQMVGQWPTVRQPNTVAVDPRTNTVIVLGANPGQLEIIHAADLARRAPSA